MFEAIKKGLGKVNLLVVVVRVLRAIRKHWREAELELQQQMDRERALAVRERVIDAYLESQAVRKLQVGAGTNPLPGWLNTDYAPVSDEIIFLDATEIFPFDDQVFDYVFSEHMIEHIPYKEGVFMLREAFRVLKPGGRLRLATPDVERIVSLLSPDKIEAKRRYLEWSAQESLGLYSPEKTRLQIHRPEWDLDHNLMRRTFPDPGSDSACFVVNNFFYSYGHRFLYNASTLRSTMEEVGFVDVRRYQPGESDDDHLRGIESHQRLIGDEMNRYETMVVEARRP